jgi:hypothetical protein
MWFNLTDDDQKLIADTADSLSPPNNPAEIALLARLQRLSSRIAASEGVMTLTQAADAFEQADGPNMDTAINLLRAAQEYWDDGMIGRDTYAMYIRMVANDLIEMVASVEFYQNWQSGAAS